MYKKEEYMTRYFKETQLVIMQYFVYKVKLVTVNVFNLAVYSFHHLFFGNLPPPTTSSNAMLTVEAELFVKDLISLSLFAVLINKI